MNNTLVKIAYAMALILPWAIFAVNYIAPSGPDDGMNVKWRPEPYMFGVIWTAIIIAISISWFLVIRKSASSNDQVMFNLTNVLYVSVVICAVAWQIVYHQKKSNGVTAFIILFFFLVPLITYLLSKGMIYSAMLLMVLLIWAVMAMTINIVEVSQ